MKIKSLVIGLSVWFSLAHASALDQLNYFITHVPKASGMFVQKNDQGESEGSFSFFRPGRFSWLIKTPFEQRITADGKYIYQYDVELAQTIKRSLKEAIGSSPAAILFGNNKIEDYFTVSLLPTENGVQWLRAVPKDANAGFNYMDIGFADNRPVKIIVQDIFDHFTEITFNQMDTQAKISASSFKFVVPKGVEVVDMP
ncbi:LolA family protein [Basilea psittacipulmonis]|uniref:Outer-membrane lipoprotein carrier protein n=1 Tax=Basilea psittacipulmonis DSM 24701 TaxID=1072685 RepID=A0A077DCM8_9BURK|nr:outer-membrane lipoprotein carrier protein LolA [Basilea psittacipulmonis]AIL32354.1 hypothetical protein IX83_02610 [Basilea psittacipulmonis DSM 24701]